MLAVWFLPGLIRWSPVYLYLGQWSPARAFMGAFIWQPWFPSLYASQLFPFGGSLCPTADFSSREPGLPLHWSPQPSSDPIGPTILSRPWVRSFGVGYSAVRSPCYLPDSLLDFLSPKHTFTTFWCIFRRQNGDSVKHFIDTNPWTSREMHFFTDFCLL